MLQLKLILAGIVSVGLITGTAWTTHRVDQAGFDKAEQQWEKNKQKAIDGAVAIKAAQDNVVLQNALKEAKAQTIIQTQIQTVIKEVPKYVKVDDIGCITYGLVRVLDAAAIDADPGELPIPAGKSNDSCTGLTTVDLASHVAGNYGIARANAQQLNDLEQTVRDMIAAANKPQGDTHGQ